MIDQVIDGTPDADKRGCKDCRHMRGAVSWWCMNDEARKRHGSGIPGYRDCENWEPCATLAELPLLTRMLVKSGLHPGYMLFAVDDELRVDQ